MNLANALSLHRDFSEAVEEYRTALALSPRDAEVHVALASASLQSGDAKVAPGCDKTSSLGLAERLRRSVIATPVPTSGGPIPVTLTLGVASLAEDPNPDSLLRSADDALYRGKKAGRNRSELATP